MADSDTSSSISRAIVLWKDSRKGSGKTTGWASALWNRDYSDWKERLTLFFSVTEKLKTIDMNALDGDDRVIALQLRMDMRDFWLSIPIDVRQGMRYHCLVPWNEQTA